jgi:hypothetical protein
MVRCPRKWGKAKRSVGFFERLQCERGPVGFVARRWAVEDTDSE